MTNCSSQDYLDEPQRGDGQSQTYWKIWQILKNQIDKDYVCDNDIQEIIRICEERKKNGNSRRNKKHKE